MKVNYIILYGVCRKLYKDENECERDEVDENVQTTGRKNIIHVPW